jgi:hypothetical protein
MSYGLGSSDLLGGPQGIYWGPLVCLSHSLNSNFSWSFSLIKLTTEIFLDLHYLQLQVLLGFSVMVGSSPWVDLLVSWTFYTLSWVHQGHSYC